jgi:GntR family transcriptional regulator
MKVLVDTASPIPAYEQIRAQVTALADNGVLTPGTRLPPIRQLAADLGLAPGTVAKAYALLEKAGVTSTHRRRGTLITDRGVLDPARQLSELRRAASAFARTVRLLDVDRATALEAVDAALTEDQDADRRSW